MSNNISVVGIPRWKKKKGKTCQVKTTNYPSSHDEIVAGKKIN